MIEQINDEEEVVVDSNNNTNKQRNVNNQKKHSTSSLIKFLGNKIRRRATSLNDLNVSVNTKLPSSKSRALNKLNSSIEDSSTCSSTNSDSTSSKQANCACQAVRLGKNKSSSKYYKDCCHVCSPSEKPQFFLTSSESSSKKMSIGLLTRNYSYNYADQIVPLERKQQKNSSKMNKNESSSSSSNFSNRSSLNEFDNFNQMTFYKQCNLVTNWFKNMNEENKNSLLSMLLDNCGPNQNHLFSLKIVKPHSDCAPNCCDMISYLPKMITFQIFSYLDPVSLARASQVNKLWYESANDKLLWKRLCHLANWRFSAASEAKQIEKYKNQSTQTVNWKGVFAERFRVKRNWLTGKSVIKTFYGHEDVVSCVQFDDTRIVAGSAAGTIKVWNISESLSSTSTMAQSAYMPYLNLFGHSGTIRCLHLDSQLNRLFSGSADHTIKVWDLSEVHPTWSRVTCKMTFLGHTDTVRCLQLNGTILISGSYDNSLKIWDLKTGACTNTLKGHTDAVLCLQFDDAKIISGSADRTIRIWNFEGKCLAQLEGHTGSVTCLHFDSQRIISGSLDFDIKFWRIDNGMCVNTLNWITKEGHTAAIRCLKADSQKIVSCSDDKTIKIWNIETGERYVTLKNHSDGVTCLQFNDYYILSGSYDRTIKLWDFSAN